MNPHGLKVGQKVYYVGRYRRGDTQWLTITKIGRVWAYTDLHVRFRVDDLRMYSDNNSPMGDIYLSKEVYDEAVTRDRLRRLIRDRLDSFREECPDLATLKSIAELLGMEVTSGP